MQTWPTTRLLFLLAGTMTLLSVLLALTWTPWAMALTAFVGVNQLVFVAFGACPASLLIDRARACPAAGTVSSVPGEV